MAQGTDALSIGFYQSDAWVELRYKAIKRYGKTCHCCGSIGGPGNPIHVDHIKPRSKHPEVALDIDNLQILCMKCNLGKHAWDQTDWRPIGKVHNPMMACGFCGDSEQHAESLFGHEAMICEACVATCVELMAGKLPCEHKALRRIRGTLAAITAVD